MYYLPAREQTFEEVETVMSGVKSILLLEKMGTQWHPGQIWYMLVA